MNELGRLLRTLAHTRPRQLVARAARIAKRFAHDRGMDSGALDSTPPLADAPPHALFAPRRDRLVDELGPSVRVLATTHALLDPIDWRPRAWNELLSMNLHYMEFLEALDDDTFVRAVRSWIEGNPWRVRGSWRVAWNSYVIALRVVVWMQQLALRRERLPREFVDAAHASLALQVRVLERNLERDLGGNHLIKDAKALAWAGRYFAGDEASRWLERGHELLAREVDEQVLADGMHYERSPAYHAQVFADLLECTALVDGARLRAALDAMAQVVIDTAHPDGLTSLFNDGGLHMTYAPSECLAVYARVTGKWVTARNAFALGSAGYFGARNGDDFVLADCGAIAPDHLPAHGHGDQLAFEWSVGGKRVVVDAGVFEYEPGTWRERSRSAGSHNTVTLDDAEPCEFWAAFRVGRRARARVDRFERSERGFVLEGSHDGYAHLAGEPRHSRTITATPAGIEVDDRVLGGDGQRVRARLLLHPEARIEQLGDDLLVRVGGSAVTLTTKHACKLVDAWWCPDFGVRLPAKQLVLDYGVAPCRGAFVLRRVSVAPRAAEPRSLVDVADRQRRVRA